MNRKLKYSLAIAAAILALAQAFRPDRQNPDEIPAQTFAVRMAPPENVERILQRACYDCHSNRTDWPWYSAVAPVSWLVSGDVRQGRSHLNLSEWGTYRTARRITALNMIVSVVDKEEMPPLQYVILHPSAALTDADKDALLDWAEAAADSLTNDSADK